MMTRPPDAVRSEVELAKNLRSRAKAMWFSLITLMVSVSIAALLRNPINGDVAFHLYAAERMLDGLELYSDIIDPNPPLIYYLSIPPAWLSRVTGWPSDRMFLALAAAFVLLSLGLCSRVLRRIFGDYLVPRYSLLLVFAFSFIVFHYAQFGQREHLMFVLASPYILSAALPAGARNRWWEDVALGTLAGVGFAIKPHFLLIWLGIQGYNLLNRKRWERISRPSNLAVIGIQITYWSIVLTAVPSYWFVVQLAMPVYDGFGGERSSLVFGSRCLGFVVLAAAVVILSNERYRDIGRVLCAVGIGAAGSFVVQGGDFPHRWYPLASTSLLLLAILVLSVMDESAQRSPVVRLVKTSVLAVVLGIMTFEVAVPLVSPRRPHRGDTEGLISVLREHASGEYVLVLSTDHLFPLISYGGAKLSWRFSSLWPLPGLYPIRFLSGTNNGYPSTSKMDAMERYMLDSLIVDTQVRPPKLIIVETGPDKLGFSKGDVDFLDYFLRDGRFARFWKNYAFLADVARFRVFVRK